MHNEMPVHNENASSKITRSLAEMHVHLYRSLRPTATGLHDTLEICPITLWSICHMSSGCDISILSKTDGLGIGNGAGVKDDAGDEAAPTLATNIANDDKQERSSKIWQV